jgi:Uma2 family endonuclease
MLDDARMSRMTGHQHMDEARESRRKLTYRDFVRFPEDGRRHELIDGEHVVTAAPNAWHQAVLQRLSLAVGKHLEAAPVGLVFFARTDCIFSFFDVVEPDLFVIMNDQREILTKRNIKGAPAIVAEILSPSTSRNDAGIKRALYERGGVREYWIVDPEDHTIVVYALSRGALRKAATRRAADGDDLSTKLLPGFSLQLSELFRDW